MTAKPPIQKMHLREYLDQHYLPSRPELSERYVGELYTACRKLSAILGQPSALGHLTEWNLRKFQRDLPATGVSTERASSLRGFLKTIWIAAAKDGLVDPPPVRPTKPKGRPPKNATTAVHDATIANARRAAFLMAAGMTQRQVAKSMGVTPPMVTHWRRVCPELFDLPQPEADREMRALVSAVRKAIGTDAVIDDPDGHIRRATVAETWLEERGESLTASNEPTLCSIFETHYLPMRLSDATRGTIYLYRMTLKRWQLAVGDPPVDKITPLVLTKFRDHLAASRGRRPHLRMEPKTIKSKLQSIQTLLDFAGPPGRGNRDALGLIDRSPWIKPPRVEPKPHTIVSDEVLRDVYTAAVGMEVPRLPGFKPAAWWRALLVLAYSTGLRKGSLMAIRMDWIDWQARTITIPAHGMKARRPHTVYLNQTALDHLQKIHTRRELLFEWPMNDRDFYVYLGKLQKLAGVPKAQRFGLHAIRRTHATALWRTNPAAAQLSLHHSGLDVTVGHYVRSEGILSEALNALPMPAAFTGGRPAASPPDAMEATTAAPDDARGHHHFPGNDPAASTMEAIPAETVH